MVTHQILGGRVHVYKGPTCQLRPLFILFLALFAFSSLAVHAQTKEKDEAAVIYEYCSGKDITNTLFDCRCIAENFVELRAESGPDRSWQMLLKDLWPECPSEEGAATYASKMCRANLPIIPYGGETFCKCVAKAFVPIFKETPNLGGRMIQSQLSSAMSVCDDGDGPYNGYDGGPEPPRSEGASMDTSGSSEETGVAGESASNGGDQNSGRSQALADQSAAAQTSTRSATDGTSSDAPTMDADLVEIRWNGIPRVYGNNARLYKVCLGERNTPAIKQYLLKVGKKADRSGNGYRRVSTAGAEAAANRLAKYYEGLVILTTEDCLARILERAEMYVNHYSPKIDMSEFIVSAIGSDGRLERHELALDSNAASGREVARTQRQSSKSAEKNSSALNAGSDKRGMVEIVSKEYSKEDIVASSVRYILTSYCASHNAVIDAYGGPDNFPGMSVSAEFEGPGNGFRIGRVVSEKWASGAGSTINRAHRLEIFVTTQECLPIVLESMESVGIDRTEFLVRPASPENWYLRSE